MPYTANAELQEFFNPGPLRRSARRMCASVLDLLDKEVVRRTPVARVPPGVGREAFAAQRGRPPGTLRKSWQTSDVDETVTPTGVPRFSGEEYTLDPLGPLVEWPTRPHLIRPRPDRGAASVLATRRPRRAGTDPAARLRWVNAFGRVVYAAEVHHPGTQGAHMMRDSLAEVDATWTRRVGEAEVARWAREQVEHIR